MLHFDPATGFYADDTETVRAAVAADWVAAFHKDGQVDLNTDPETPAGQLIDSQTAAITEKDTELLYLCNQFDPAKNEGIFQDAIAKIYFLSRKAATPSTATITVRGLSGTVIPVNAQIMSSADDTIWQNVAAFTIGADGTGSVFASLGLYLLHTWPSLLIEDHHKSLMQSQGWILNLLSFLKSSSFPDIYTPITDSLLLYVLMAF